MKSTEAGCPVLLVCLPNVPIPSAAVLLNQCNPGGGVPEGQSGTHRCDAAATELLPRLIREITLNRDRSGIGPKTNRLARRLPAPSFFFLFFLAFPSFTVIACLFDLVALSIPA